MKRRTIPATVGGGSIPMNPLLAFGPETPRIEIPRDALEMFADGSCDPNPGPGGWGFAAYCGADEIHHASGGESSTTNNRMELRGVIEALRWLGTDRAAIIWTDSAYVVRGYEAWRRGWRRGSWTKAPPRANDDLWVQVEALLSDLHVDVRWTRGHVGTAGNDRADALATNGRLNLGSAAGSARGHR